MAFYSTALAPAQILSHYDAAANTAPGFYGNLIQTDGAVLYLNNVPEPTTVGLMLLVARASCAVGGNRLVRTGRLLEAAGPVWKCYLSQMAWPLSWAMRAARAAAMRIMMSRSIQRLVDFWPA